MKRFFTLFFALPLLFVACNKQTETPGQEPVLELTSEATMEFEAEGGTGEITYNLIKGDGSLDGELGITGQISPIVITTEQDWITIIDSESIFGTIKFEVAENTTEEQRTGYITGEYSTKSFTVTINQAASAGTPEQAFDGWAVVGSFTNNWDVNAAIGMEAIEGYYVARGVEIAATDSFKFAKDGTLQNSLGGNGQAAERDYKYPTSKYGSDIRVAEAGVYDLYLNEATNAYYVMSEGKHPSEAYEEIAKGEDVWYVTGLGDAVRMHKSGVFMVASDLNISEAGFKLYYGLTGATYGVSEDVVAEVGAEIAIVENGENNIRVTAEQNKSYSIFLNVEDGKVWVMPRGSKPDVLYTCNSAEGVWFTTQNFSLVLYADGIRITLDCNCVASQDNIIPAVTYTVGGQDGNIINAELCQVANEDGKNIIVDGSVTIGHIEDGYSIYVDVVTEKRLRVRAEYNGAVKSIGGMGGSVTNPEK
ncbi:MAG: BACON domain-containing carbohydrate-binding protein [Alistipes sp.]|nr:BACON domain-containing carbohydrate-binding protein [Alistipes sp.]